MFMIMNNAIDAPWEQECFPGDFTECHKLLLGLTEVVP